jgi:hypothetical protein
MRADSAINGCDGLRGQSRSKELIPWPLMWRTLLAVVLVSTLPLILTSRGSFEQRFAWIFSLALGLSYTSLLIIGRHRQCAPGCCAGCGYNLTANITGICPECGESVERDT